MAAASAASFKIPKPWEHPAGASKRTLDGPTFNAEYPTEFRMSGIPGAGRGWFAKDVPIPKGTRLRRLCCEDGSGTLLCFGSYEELMEQTSWNDFYETVHYGVGLSTGARAGDTPTDNIYFLNPGTACNHACPTPPSIEYRFDEATGVCELWTCRDVAPGDEMFIDYSSTFSKCEWFDTRMKAKGELPLSWLGDEINAMYAKQNAAGGCTEAAAVLGNKNEVADHWMKPQAVA